LRQQEKSRLKGVFGILRLMQSPAAYSQHQPCMTPDQFSKRALVLLLDEASEQLPVGCQGRPGIFDELPDLAKDSDACASHRTFLRGEQM
jgi:hypothetical protein